MTVAERRPVPGWEGFYDIDTDGNVWSLPRSVPRRNGVAYTVAGGRLIPKVHPHGYRMVHLRGMGRNETPNVHQLVMLAFVGPCPDGLEVCHWNDLPGDNRLSNLRYDTRLGNMADMVSHGHSCKGERHGASKLTADAVRELRRRSANESIGELAREFGMAHSAIRSACTGKTWKHVPMEPQPTV